MWPGPGDPRLPGSVWVLCKTGRVPGRQLPIGRIFSTILAVLCVAALAVLVVSMASAKSHPSADATSTATVGAATVAPPEGVITWPGTAATPPTAAPSLAPGIVVGATSSPAAAATTSAPPSTPAVESSTAASRPAAAPSSHAPSVVTYRLPLGFSTGNATQVVTVVASSYSSTTALLQTWNKASNGGWLPWGPAIIAHVGSQGLTTRPNETLSATPIGSFTLTRAFGYQANPGTGLPYTVTNPHDYWISQDTSQFAGCYNTMQSAPSSWCPYNQGDPNEHLYYERPYYANAVVIDYNTANAPGGIRLGAGSAFFFHVTDGTPTAGCVAIPQANLDAIMRWLTPGRHPRMLIGVN